MIFRLVLAAALVASAAPAFTPSTAQAEAKPRTICQGFRPLSGIPTYLRTVDFYEGAVTDNATLAPESSGETDGKLVNKWSFSAGQKITLVCGYGGSKQVRILPKTITFCTATFEAARRTTNWQPVDVSCG
ncbi:hypothetical protein QO010_002593 [Caulobacter ginsengisoli]|uniref:Ig-like domain-containing protein n=1 Tax=Caulobacter ginsengisoli TaxID=400775 RepID=A0ABU0IS50_9CAUL|nr:STY0301 family protein [Caulobacter ginsengisoli]MDQ0464809.1 hypothetical protein [Caulobacter ginsengisoli]